MPTPVDITPSLFEIIPSKIKIQVPDIEFDFGGYIAGWQMGSDEFSKGKLKLQATQERILFGLATEPLTGVGIFIGKDSADYEFRAGDPSGSYMHFNGSTLVLKDTEIDGFGTAAVNTGTIAASADTIRAIDQATFTKIKEFKIKVSGDYDVYFEIRMTTASGEAHGRIYKNGSAQGTDQSETSQTFVAYNETVATLVVGDLIQFYGHKTIDNGEVQNFRLRSVISPDATVVTD